MPLFDFTYIVDDAPNSDREDIPIGIGFELDPDNGGITWITRAAARQLLCELLKSFPFTYETGTESNATVAKSEFR